MYSSNCGKCRYSQDHPEHGLAEWYVLTPAGEARYSGEIEARKAAKRYGWQVTVKHPVSR